MTVANDSAAPMTLAGRPFSVRERVGGLLNLRVAIHGGAASDFAQDLAALSGVRVVRGPESMGRGTCFLAHCPGFKLVLSGHKTDGSLSLLVSRAPTEVGAEKTSQLSSVLTLLMQAQPSGPSDASPLQKGFAFGKTTPPRPITSPLPRPQSFSAASFLRKRKPSPSAPALPLRQTALRPGKPLARGKPLVRRTPLGRGKGIVR
jgi:hypothetical protein